LVGGRLDSALEVEAVDRLDEPDRADLDEVLELLAAIRVAAGERTDERHVLLDQLFTRMEVTLLVIFPQENLVVDARHLVSCLCRRRSPLRERDPVVEVLERQIVPRGETTNDKMRDVPEVLLRGQDEPDLIRHVASPTSCSSSRSSRSRRAAASLPACTACRQSRLVLKSEAP